MPRSPSAPPPRGGHPAISRRFRKCCGAGTVLTHDQLDRALDAVPVHRQSRFNPDTVRYGLSKGAHVPGTATPARWSSHGTGLSVKFFPAEQNGGVAKLKALAGPYKTLKWMPTAASTPRIWRIICL